MQRLRAVVARPHRNTCTKEILCNLLPMFGRNWELSRHFICFGVFWGFPKGNINVLQLADLFPYMVQVPVTAMQCFKKGNARVKSALPFHHRLKTQYVPFLNRHCGYTAANFPPTLFRSSKQSVFTIKVEHCGDVCSMESCGVEGRERGPPSCRRRSVQGHPLHPAQLQVLHTHIYKYQL